MWTATPQWRDGQASKHLIHCELFDKLRPAGFKILPGEIGENITTRGIDVLALPTGTKLLLGSTAVVQVTGLRNPCRQLDQHQSGLIADFELRSARSAN